MRLIDLLTLSLAALWQQKMRTALTLLGVIVGSFILVMCLSVGQGYARRSSANTVSAINCGRWGYVRATESH